jgi:hypothetical protein
MPCFCHRLSLRGALAHDEIDHIVHELLEVRNATCSSSWLLPASVF